MLPTDIKSPGYLSNGVVLRQQAYKAISYADIMSNQSPDSTTAAVLAEFFEDCAAKCKAIAKDGAKRAKARDEAAKAAAKLTAEAAAAESANKETKE